MEGNMGYTYRGDLPQTGVRFRTEDAALQELFELAQQKAKKNIFDFGGTKVMIEGSALYRGVWIETQPMGGEIYAAQDAEVALGNQLIFINNAREDGRLPGCIFFEEGKLRCRYDMLQGYCFPVPALKTAWWIGLDKGYLSALYKALRAHDEYLWKYRDPAGTGCLQSWCVWDTGEDNGVRFGKADDSWSGETPPCFERMPFYSMDVMSYSYDGRKTLARISELLGNGEEAMWREKAEYVRRRLREYLWREEKGACYDRDRFGNFTDTLLHNNLRCMYHGSFTQDMAERFVREHLLNPNEFWTPFPLPSVAANDPAFRNLGENNWSGQPQSLTYQRAIFTLENYGFYSLMKQLGEKYLSVMKRYKMFVQQFDPFLCKPSMSHDDYGPSILAVFAYVAHLYGIFRDEDTLAWTSAGGADGEYEQTIGENRYTLSRFGDTFTGFRNGKELFSASAGVRVVTDFEGKIRALIGIDGGTVRLNAGGRTLYGGELPADRCIRFGA